MADPFYRWNPIRHGYYPRAPIQPPAAKPKVVNIPVHFVRSDNEVRKQLSAPATASTVAKRNSRAAAAVAIQRAARGFLVRKNMRVVRQVAADVDEIERKVREEEDVIRSDPREQLRVSEGLMALLLRLDSVRGVRNFRKKVIRRVILLQEAVDSISANGDGKISTDDREDSRGKEAEESSIVHDQVLDLQETDKAETELESISIFGITEDQEQSMREAMESSTDNIKAEDQSLNLDETELVSVNENRAEVESTKRNSDLIGTGLEEEGMPPIKSETRNTDVKGELMTAEPLKEARGLKEMIERMASENEGLKLLVARLCETNAEQCLLMEGLADRVNRLERTAHRMDRRKKRKSCAACPAFSSAK